MTPLLTGSSPPPPKDSGGTIEVAAGLILREDKLLITQRYPEAHQGGLWEFPGGKRQASESLEQCLRRELREELGIEVEVEKFVASLVHEYPDKTVVLKFFRCAWREKEPQALGCADFRWVRLEELSQYKFPAADARLLQNLRSYLP